MQQTVRRILCAMSVTALVAGLTLSAHAGEKKAAKRDQLSFEGVISALDFKAGTVTIKKKDGTMTFQVPDTCSIYVEHVKASAKLSHLKVGDKIEVYYVEADGALIAQRIGEKGAHADKKERREEKGK